MCNEIVVADLHALGLATRSRTEEDYRSDFTVVSSREVEWWHRARILYQSWELYAIS